MVTKMQLRLLKQETQIITNEQSPVKVAPVSWLSWGEVNPLYCSDGRLWGFLNVSTADDIPISSDDLPIEFYNHEIADFTGNEGDICAFLGRFGAPYMPDESPIQSDEIAAFYVDMMRGAVALPDDLAAAVRSFASEYGESALTLGLLRGRLADRVISLAETMQALDTMKRAFRSILAAIDAAISEPNAQGFYSGSEPLNDALLFAVNSWADNADMVTCGGSVVYPSQYMGVFLGAICSQFIQTAKDPEPWRRCRCCGRLFKRKAILTDRHRFNHPKRAPRDLITFCSNRCEFKYNKRKQRGNNPSDKANERNGGR